MSFEPLLSRKEIDALSCDLGVHVPASPAEARTALVVIFLASAGVAWFFLSIALMVWLLTDQAPF